MKTKKELYLKDYGGDGNVFVVFFPESAAIYMDKNSEFYRIEELTPVDMKIIIENK